MNLRGAIRTAQREAIVDGSRPDEDYTVSIKPGLQTALWIWLPPHRIYVGDGAPRFMRPALGVEDQQHYIASYVYHEYSHARHTCRDAAATRAMLVRVGCSMGLLNLFEDARIEAAWRQRTKRLFRWSELEVEQPARPLSPSGALLEWIQQEGDRAKVAALAERGRCDEVEPFYRRATETDSTLALEPLLAEWFKLYGDADLPNSRFVFGPGMAGELQIALDLQVDPGALNAFDAGTTPVELSPRSEDDPLGSVELAGIGDSDLLAEEAVDVEENAARRHAERLTHALTVKSRTHYSETPSMRTSAWRADAGRPAYRHRVEGRIAKRRRVLVVDCSGSMDGEHIEAARTLVRTMSLLAERGALEGELILSAVAGDESVSESHAWPVPAAVTQRIHAFGDAEGLADAIDTHIGMLRRAEKVYVFTDGNICDKPMRLAALRRAGVEVIGLYVGDVTVGTRGLQRHFDRFAARETLAGLVDFLISDREDARN